MFISTLFNFSGLPLALLLQLHFVYTFDHHQQQIPQGFTEDDDDTDLLTVDDVPRFADLIRFSPFHYGFSLRKTHLQPQRQFRGVSVQNSPNLFRKQRNEGRLHSLAPMDFPAIFSLIRSGRLFPSERILERIRTAEGTTQTQVEASQIANELPPPVFERHHQNRQAKIVSRPCDSFREMLLKALNRTQEPTKKGRRNRPGERKQKEEKESGRRETSGKVWKKAEGKFGGIRGREMIMHRRKKGRGRGM